MIRSHIRKSSKSRCKPRNKRKVIEKHAKLRKERVEQSRRDGNPTV